MAHQPALQPREELEELQKGLKKAIASAGRSISALSEDLGFHSLYLVRALSGARRLRVDLVFQILARLDQVPELFFADVFPLGGAFAELRARAAKGRPQERSESSLRIAVRDQARRRGAITPSEHELRAGELLRLVLQRRGATQRAASQALGLGPDALGQVLRGSARLTFLHLFGILRFTGTTPGRFFFELFLPRPPEPEEIHERAALLDVIERLVEETSKGLLARSAPAKKGGKRDAEED